MMTFFMHVAGTRQVEQLPRQRGEAETPTSNQPPRVNRGRRPFGTRGAPNLTFGFAAKPSPSAPWARGLLLAFWEWGSPDLPACSPRHGYASGHVRSIFINKAFETLASRTTQALLKSGHTRLPREERRNQGGANLARLS